MNRLLKALSKGTMLTLLTLLLLTQWTHADPLVIRNVNVLTMESDQILENQSIVIDNGLIQWIGPDSELQLPENAEVIEGDFYVMPGLAEMHAHIPSSRQGVEAMERVLNLNLAMGITTVRGMLGDPLHLELRDKAESSGVHYPRIITSGPSFNGNTATSPDVTRQMVRDQAEAGYDLLKLHPGITLENFKALADEAQKQEIEFSGHISAGIGLERTLDSGQGTIEHIDRYMEFLAGEAADRPEPPVIFFGYDLTPHVNASKIDQAATMTRDAGVWVVPTNTLLENVFNPDYSPEAMSGWPGMEFVSEGVLNSWVNTVRQIRASDAYDKEQASKFLKVRNDLTKSLQEHGDRLLLGADSPQIFNPPGFATHRELALLVEAGLTPYEAIKTGTVNVGRYLGETGETGIIAPGYRADLILLHSNPLEAIPFHDAISGVIYRGFYLSEEELDDLLNSLRE